MLVPFDPRMFCVITACACVICVRSIILNPDLAQKTIIILGLP